MTSTSNLQDQIPEYATSIAAMFSWLNPNLFEIVFGEKIPGNQKLHADLKQIPPGNNGVLPYLQSFCNLLTGDWSLREQRIWILVCSCRVINSVCYDSEWP